MDDRIGALCALQSGFESSCQNIYSILSDVIGCDGNPPLIYVGQCYEDAN